jgi:threonyl-tRNA synthetase
MRILILHVDRFLCRVTERGRSRVYEEPARRETELVEGLVVLTSVEKVDEDNLDGVCERGADEIEKLAQSVKTNRILIHPFAHLFGELSTPEAAVEGLMLLSKALSARGFEVSRTPFGWFNTLEIKAKGHPLSRVARIIT